MPSVNTHARPSLRVCLDLQAQITFWFGFPASGLGVQAYRDRASWPYWKMATDDFEKKASSDPSLQKGKAWIDVASMVVIFVVLLLVFWLW